MIPQTIAIEGLPGVGKSTLAFSLADELKYNLNPEPEDEATKDLLVSFYKEPVRHAFSLQVRMLALRSLQERAGAANLAAASISGMIYDRTVLGDSVFARTNYLCGNISKSEYDTYLLLAKHAYFAIHTPCVVIYLHAPRHIIEMRQKSRNRHGENITQAYMDKLEMQYTLLIQKLSNTTCIIPLDWTNPMPTHDVVAAIQRAWLTKNMSQAWGLGLAHMLYTETGGKLHEQKSTD
jgi:deoxyadenosine/deoxycytidine kinase